jgi:hypothetical protein
MVMVPSVAMVSQMFGASGVSASAVGHARRQRRQRQGEAGGAGEKFAPAGVCPSGDGIGHESLLVRTEFSARAIIAENDGC